MLWLFLFFRQLLGKLFCLTIQEPLTLQPSKTFIAGTEAPLQRTALVNWQHPTWLITYITITQSEKISLTSLSPGFPQHSWLPCCSTWWQLKLGASREVSQERNPWAFITSQSMHLLQCWHLFWGLLILHWLLQESLGDRPLWPSSPHWTMAQVPMPIFMQMICTRSCLVAWGSLFPHTHGTSCNLHALLPALGINLNSLHFLLIKHTCWFIKRKNLSRHLTTTLTYHITTSNKHSRIKAKIIVIGESTRLLILVHKCLNNYQYRKGFSEVSYCPAGWLSTTHLMWEWCIQFS